MTEATWSSQCQMLSKRAYEHKEAKHEGVMNDFGQGKRLTSNLNRTRFGTANSAAKSTEQYAG